MRCEGGGEGHGFGDGGDDVVGLHRFVLGDICGGADGCVSGDEALLGMGDAHCLGNGACLVERGSAGCPVHVTLVEGGL